LGFDTDKRPNFPSALPNENILAVAAVDINGDLTTYSNFGARTVDIAAFGGDQKELLVSTFLENPSGQTFAAMAGTSMAAPLVTGLAAQVWSLNPELTAIQVKQLIMQHSTPQPGLAPYTVSGRMIDDLIIVQAAKAGVNPALRRALSYF
jgi:serine protease